MKLSLLVKCFLVFVGCIHLCVVANTNKNDPGAIDIAAFNVRIFGKTKMSKPSVVDNLVKIILRYDLILLQEIRDSSQTAIYDLLRQVNSRSGSVKYNIIVSARLGRSSSKEQYAYIYNSNVFTMDSHYVYDDSASDVFQREPFVVKFSSTLSSVSTFIAIGIHTAPSAAATEIDKLVDVYNDAKNRLGVSEAIIMGDFNAGCTYVSDWSSIRLATDHRFYWLINDVTDTTSGSTECAYDRFVVVGDRLVSAIKPLSPGVFHYDTEYGLTTQQALLVSDHYPVAMKIKTLEAALNIGFTRKFEVKDSRIQTSTPSGALLTILAAILKLKSTYSVDRSYTSRRSKISFTAKFTASSLTQSYANLDAAKGVFSPFLSDVQVGVAKRHLKELSMVQFLPRSNGYYYTLRDYYKNKATGYMVAIECKYKPQGRCSILAEVENGA